MKRFFLSFLLLMMILCACGFGCAENEQPKGFQETLRSVYGVKGGQVLSSSAYGPRGAAVIQTESGCFLSVLSLKQNAWQVDYENHQAVCENSRVYLDTEELLILSECSYLSDTISEQYYFTWNHEWLLSDVIRYDERPDEWNLLSEYNTCRQAGWLYTRLFITDLEGNILGQRQEMALPDVLTEQEISLSTFAGFDAPVNGLGYKTDDSMMVSDDLLRRLFSRVIQGDYTYVDGLKNKSGLQFIADKKDGTRVLLCCAYYGSAYGWQVTESTPLPEGTVIGIENFVNTLNLGLTQTGVSIGRNGDGSWGATGALINHGGWFDIGPCYVGDGGCWWNAAPCIGATPWGDITKMDWASIPKSVNEAKARMSTDGWATPNNPNPKDRLHLRTAPSKSADSLGKYYNGTPLKVLERKGDWTQVRIGEQTGYMMTKYLLFGDQINTQKSALYGKTNRQPLTEIFWDGSKTPELLLNYEVDNLLVIGVLGDEWYLMWDADLNRCGRIRQNALWDGNG